MQYRTSQIGWAAAVAAAFASAGVPASAQVSQAETYQLAEVAGAPLPAVLEQDDEGCREEVLGATLTLNPNGEWALTTRERETCGNDVEEDEEVEDGTYQMDGGTIRFLDDDGESDVDDAATDDLDLEGLVGTRSADALTIRLADGETALVFRR